MQPIVAHCCEVMYFGLFGFKGELFSLLLLGLCVCVVLVDLGLSVRLSWYPMLWVRLLR